MSPPSAFGTYRVLHQIGSGVLGPVFRAYDSQLDRLVAIKTFKLDLVPEDAARLADRLRALAAERPAHPAVVGAVEAGLQGATPFIALEYASGESLDVILRQSGAWPVARVLPVLREVALAIDASWAGLVGHGALHPRDIFVTAGSTDVRITGFGIGQALEAIGAKAPVRRPYSAAERGDGAAWDIRADVYSLGVVAYELVSGQRPVGPDDEGDALGPAESLGGIRRVLAVAMADSPADRYETATAFVEAFAAAAQLASTVPAAEGHDGPKRASRIRRARPIVLDLPLLPGMDEKPSEDVGRALELGASDIAPAPAVVPDPAPEVVPVAAARPDPVPAPAPAHARSVSPVAPLRLRDVETPLVGEAQLEVGPPATFEEEPVVAVFPWAAVIAVFAAGLVLSGVVFYQLGWTRGSAAARAVMTGTAPAQTPAAIAAPAGELAATPDPAPSTPAASPSPAPDPAPAGRLVVQSTPSGALVTVDGRRVGETPITVPVTLGRHDVQIARSGYVPRIETVNVTKRSASRTLDVQLRRGADSSVPTAPAMGTVDVDSRPRGARVTVDGRFIGTTPIRVPELTVGDHRIQIELAGYKTVTSTAKVVRGELTRLTVTLEPGGVTRVQAPGGIR